MLHPPSSILVARPPAGSRRLWSWWPAPVCAIVLGCWLMHLPGGGLLANRAAQVSGEQHALYTTLLQAHVRAGLVDYSTITADPRLDEVLARLAAINPADLNTEAEQAAYWLNVYNAFTLKLIADHYPVSSINELHLWGSLYLGTVLAETIWHNYEFRLYGGRTYTLDEVEHEILRPIYQDYRHHAALVCAANSCPPLRNEAYEGQRLNQQLDDQMRTWLADGRRNYYDAANRKLYVSSIFNWFESDFTRDGRELVDVLLPYFPAETRTRLQADRDRVRIKYLPYDWNLNQAGR